MKISLWQSGKPWKSLTVTICFPESYFCICSRLIKVSAFPNAKYDYWGSLNQSTCCVWPLVRFDSFPKLLHKRIIVWWFRDIVWYSVLLLYRRTSLFAVDTFCQLSANTETANTESNNDLKREDRFQIFDKKVNSIYMLCFLKVNFANDWLQNLIKIFFI